MFVQTTSLQDFIKAGQRTKISKYAVPRALEFTGQVLNVYWC